MVGISEKLCLTTIFFIGHILRLTMCHQYATPQILVNNVVPDKKNMNNHYTYEFQDGDIVEFTCLYKKFTPPMPMLPIKISYEKIEEYGILKKSEGILKKSDIFPIGFRIRMSRDQHGTTAYCRSKEKEIKITFYEETSDKSLAVINGKAYRKETQKYLDRNNVPLIIQCKKERAVGRPGDFKWISPEPEISVIRYDGSEVTLLQNRWSKQNNPMQFSCDNKITMSLSNEFKKYYEYEPVIDLNIYLMSNEIKPTLVEAYGNRTTYIVYEYKNNENYKLKCNKSRDTDDYEGQFTIKQTGKSDEPLLLGEYHNVRKPEKVFTYECVLKSKLNKELTVSKIVIFTEMAPPIATAAPTVSSTSTTTTSKPATKPTSNTILTTDTETTVATTQDEGTSIVAFTPNVIITTIVPTIVASATTNYAITTRTPPPFTTASSTQKPGPQGLKDDGLSIMPIIIGGGVLAGVIIIMVFVYMYKITRRKNPTRGLQVQSNDVVYQNLPHDNGSPIPPYPPVWDTYDLPKDKVEDPTYTEPCTNGKPITNLKPVAAVYTAAIPKSRRKPACKTEPTYEQLYSSIDRVEPTYSDPSDLGQGTVSPYAEVSRDMFKNELNLAFSKMHSNNPNRDYANVDRERPAYSQPLPKNQRGRRPQATDKDSDYAEPAYCDAEIVKTKFH